MALWLLQMAMALFFCVQKKGFHEDEFYTYYSTARTNGFYVEDQSWMDAETIRDEFVVLPGQQFRYGLVRQVQSWDVHPPVYYWIFHTVASLVPGVFSKWIGLSVNLLCHGINILLLAWLCYRISGGQKKLTLILTGFYWMTPAALSGVVFIRMYELLTTWVLLCAGLHVTEILRMKENRSDVREEKLSGKRFLIPMMGVTYLGYLTQYYYAVFLFFAGFGFVVWLVVRERKLRNVLYYAGTQAVALALSYVTYPACLGQMFRGQRGAQATENFLDLSNTWERLVYFYDLLNEYVFGKYLLVFWLLLVVLLISRVLEKRRIFPEICKDAGREPQVWLLVFAVAGYFVTVSKTGLLYEGTSIRYQLPVYGMVVLLLLMAMKTIWESKARYIILLCLLVINVKGLLSGKVEFLYPEAEQRVEFAAEQATQGTETVYLYKEGDEWCIWGVADELMQYPGVYFVSASGEDRLKDTKIKNSRSLVAYVAEGADAGTQLQRLLQSNPNLRNYTQVTTEKYCDVYLLE